MVFSRIFGKQGNAPPPPPPEGDEEAVEPEPDEPEAPEGADESAPEDWLARAQRVIPRGASTGSKRVDVIYGSEPAGEEGLGAPTHFVKAAGCHLVTTEGETLVDCTMALGSVALGYAEPRLTRAVIETLASGSVAGLSPALEVEVAERFCAMIPCAERVQFLKTGADAVSAAVRIARTYTGREHVIGCGYFGWHDWWSDKPGVPAGTRQQFRTIPFDDVAALERAVSEAGDSLAAVVLEPVIERLPSKEWIERARTLCDTAGAALVFDEIKTGFRLATAGYQQYAEITPDLAAFGKAMANGYPIAAVCGKAALMEAANKTWISSTLASETGALAAVAVVLDWYDKADICDTLWSTGRDMRKAVTDAIAASGIEGVAVDGIDPMWFLRFDDAAVETDFLLAAVRNGVLFKRGAYNFAAVAHDEDAIREIESGASAAFVELIESAQ
jgi:glutamate-1-semialdehyde 2,1-aminomutase